jgi:hypothetical protein
MDDKEIKRKFCMILQKAERLGLTVDQLTALKSTELFSVKRSWQNVYDKMVTWIIRHSILISAILAVLLALFVSITAADWPITKKTITESWFYGYNMEKERCLIMGRESLDIARPPVDCGICIGIKDVDRVSNLTPDTFEDKYAYSGRPVVITDGTKSWTAIKTFTFEFFKNIYAHDSPVLLNVEENCQFFPYKTTFESLGEVFNMSSDRAHMKDGSKPWYVGW